jgi:hypothetical protein
MATMTTLERSSTLAAIRAGGRAAWKEDYLYVEGRIYRIVALPSPGGANHVAIRPSALAKESPLLQDGWRELPS